MESDPQPIETEPLDERRAGSLLPPGSEAPRRASSVGPDPAVDLSPRRFDFRAPSFLTPAQWRKLGLEHERYADALGSRLSNYLRLDVPLRLARLETQNWDQFAASLSDSSHFTMFKTEPARGLGVLEVPPQLGLTIVDRVLGGTGETVAANRDLSELEIALLDQAVLLMLNEWCHLWAGKQELRPAILGHETSGRFLPGDPRNPVMLVFSLKAKVGNCPEELTYAVPCATLEALLPKSGPPAEPLVSDTTRPAPVPPVWNPRFNGVELTLMAQWPERSISARELTRLKVGDVLEWDPAASANVRLLVVQAAKFIGRLGTKNGHWAVEITGLCSAAGD